MDIPPIADGQWHHIVVIRNAAEGNAAFYVDGVGQTDLCGDLEYRALTVEEGGLIIGQEQDRLGGDFDPNQVLDGSLDDLRVYDKVLSAAEVQTLLGQDDPGEPPLEPEEPPVERPSPLVAYYPFNGDASDASGNEYHGVLSGPEPGEDRFGNEAGALVFQGTTDRIDLPHQVLDGLRDVSVSLWLKTTNSGQQAIVSGANRSNDNEYLIYLPREEQFILFSHGRAGRLQHECAVNVEPMADGRWHHIVWVRNASEGYSDFYVDGAKAGRIVCRAPGIQGAGDRGRGSGPRPGPGPAGRGICGGPGFPGIAGRSLDIRPGADGRGGPGPAGQGRARGGQGGGERKRLPSPAAWSPTSPNPFNNSTWIPYRLAASGHVRLAIYNMLGQPVRVLVDEFQSAGSHRVHWDARDRRGSAVAAGVYLARLVHPGGVHSRRLLYLE